MALGFVYIESYRTGVLKLEMIVDMPSIRHAILAIYYTMLGHKLIVSIESLKEEVKNELWTVCKPYTAGITRAEVIEFVKCYWALDKLAEIKTQ